MAALTLDDFHTAQDRVRKHIHCTPVLTCSALDEMAGCSLHFKVRPLSAAVRRTKPIRRPPLQCELFQKTGSFKARGALNAVLSLSDAEAARGVVTHSSGNHAAAVAFAARKRGIRAIVVMVRAIARGNTRLAGGKSLTTTGGRAAGQRTAGQARGGGWVRGRHTRVRIDQRGARGACSSAQCVPWRHRRTSYP